MDVNWDLPFATYPVPFNDNLFVEYNYDYSSEIKIQVFDVKGMLVQEVTTHHTGGSQSVTKLDLSGVENQMLFVKVITDRGVGMKKVVSNNYRKRN